MDTERESESSSNENNHKQTSGNASERYSDDPALWKDIDDDFRLHLLENSVDQNTKISFANSKRLYEDGTNRSLKKEHFYRVLTNGETIKRKWMSCSESTGMVYCSVCMLFSDRETHFTNGFNDWKHINRLHEHENSEWHRAASLSASFKTKNARVDRSLLEQIDKEKAYWRAVLKRVVAVVKFLCERGLPFRGENEVFGSSQNGNVMGILELLAQFDDFLADHISRCGNAGRGVPSYLSSTVCKEFVNLMAKEVTTSIANEIKKSKYYSISVDSTPDVTHVDQSTFIIRYVLDDGTIAERFLKFVESGGQHDAESITNHILRTFAEYDLDLNDCRGQSYDSATNLSGRYSGVQARLKALNPLIHYIPCSAHTLNLVGSCAVESCNNSTSFFGFIQNFYNFFSASTKLWAKMKSAIQGKKVKSLSNTRWSARSDATSALKENFVELKAIATRFYVR